MNKNGFTLTELLAVVIIIGILTGLSLGNFRQAFERSHFSEGLQAGAALNGAISRYYYDNLDKSESARTSPSASQLDISLTNAGACTAITKTPCFRTKYFEVYYDSSSKYVESCRVKNGSTKDYCIRFYPDFSSTHALEKCRVLNSSAAGKNLCISMGYTSVSSSTYSKPNAN